MNEAVTVKKEKGKREAGRERTLSSGVRARLLPVSQAIIQDALSLIPEPKVPMWFNPEKEREEPNPADPEYLTAIAEHEREQFRVTFDVFALFGVELVDGLPEDDTWLKRLKLAERLNRLDLKRFDLEDTVDREFLFKRYVAMSNEDYVLAGLMSGIRPEEVRRAAASFPDTEVRGADSVSPAEGQHPDGDNL